MNFKIIFARTMYLLMKETGLDTYIGKVGLTLPWNLLEGKNLCLGRNTPIRGFDFPRAVTVL